MADIYLKYDITPSVLNSRGAAESGSLWRLLFLIQYPVSAEMFVFIFLTLNIMKLCQILESKLFLCLSVTRWGLFGQCLIVMVFKFTFDITIALPFLSDIIFTLVLVGFFFL